MGNKVPLWSEAALEEGSRLVGFFLNGVPEGAVPPRTLAAIRRLAYVDDDDVSAEVHHLTAGDEGGVVVPRHLT